MEAIRQILATLTLAEALKRELRHSWLSDGRQESVAEHTYQMALMAVFISPYLENPVNLERTLKMILVHDLVEAIAGDIPFFEVSDRKAQKAILENAAIEKIRQMLPIEVGTEVFERWHEFENGSSSEAKFARALDNLEVQLQHNLASLKTWQPIEHELVYTKMDKHCGHDNFLKAFCEAIKNDAELKLVEGGIPVQDIKEKLANNQIGPLLKRGSF
jgi:putative hydrolase of HD superfamily